MISWPLDQADCDRDDTGWQFNYCCDASDAVPLVVFWDHPKPCPGCPLDVSHGVWEPAAGRVCHHWVSRIIIMGRAASVSGQPLSMA